MSFSADQGRQSARDKSRREFYQSRVKKIALQDLDGYREDIDLGKRYNRKFFILSMIGFVIFVGGILRGVTSSNVRHHVWLAVGIILGGVGIIVGAMAWQFLSRPRCPGSQVKMEKYLLANPHPGQIVVIYVDRVNQTYFRCVYVIQNPPGAL